MMNCVIYVVLLTVSLSRCEEKWLDPHDMSIKPSGFVLSDAQRSNDNSQELQPSCPEEIRYSMSHYKRLINLLLSLTSADATGFRKGYLHLTILPEDYDILKSFADESNSKEDSAILRKLDQILSKCLTRSVYDQTTIFFESWLDYAYLTFFNRTTAILLCCLLIVYINYMLLKLYFTIWLVLKYILFIGWIVDFLFTWINLLQESEINRMADTLILESVPAYCNPKAMNFWQYFKYSLGSNEDCRNYHQVLHKNLFWSVSPVTVLGHQFGVLIYTPTTHLGKALGTFTSTLLSNLPWGIGIVLLPILLLFVAIIICILFSFLTETSFSLNFFHLISLQFGNEQRRIVGDVLSGHNLNAVLNVAHRNMVEDLKQLENTKTHNSDSSSSNNSLEIKHTDSIIGANSKGTHSNGNDTNCSKCLKCLESVKNRSPDDEINSSEPSKHEGSGDNLEYQT